MARYQIRTPANIFIDDIIVGMIAKAKEALNESHFFDTSPSARDWCRAMKVLNHHAELYIKSYKLCGVSSICLDHAKKTSWAPGSPELNATTQDNVYQLLPRAELDQFLEEMVGRFYDSLKSLLKQNDKEEIFSLLRTAFRAVLADYLYFNPFCGHTELCTYSVMAHSSPWWHRG
jgi:hypothetical protein